MTRNGSVLFAVGVLLFSAGCGRSGFGSPNSYPIGGTLTGLVGTGLVLATSSEPNLSVTAGATSFRFADDLAYGAAYAVTVAVQPSNPTQTCIVASGSGEMTSSAVSNIAVTCTTDSYAVGGTVSGLTGTGLTLATAGESNLSVLAGATSFSFADALASGTAYEVTVATQPSNPSQTCTVMSGSGTVTSSAVSDIAVTCTTDSYAVGGTVSGLTGTGLTLATAGESNLSVLAGATSFSFADALASGTAYAVTVATQPSNPSQICTVTGGSGTVTSSAVSNIAVTCTTESYAIGGTISGLTGAGLTLATAGEPSLTVPAGATTFSFANALASGSVYAVTVATQPANPTQTCIVTSGGSGTMTDSAVANVAITCTTNSYAIGGTISGLTGTGLTLATAGEPTLTVPAGSTTFGFANTLASGTAYTVTVATQPTSPSQTCTVTNGSGTLTNGAVSNVAVTCTTNTYQVGGTISGLTGTGLTLATSSEPNLTVAAGSTSFGFANALASGTAYAVTVAAQPTNPTQTCTVANGSGAVNNGAVSNIVITCTTNVYQLGGTISGLTGTGLTLTTAGEPNLVVASGATTFDFATQLASGTGYAVTVATQPSSPPQTCVVASGSGTVTSGAVSNVAVTCLTNSYMVGGTISGLSGTGLTLATAGESNLTVPAGSTTFDFATPLGSGTAYAVTVATQPSSPSQTCTVASGSGTVTTGAISNIAITCTTNVYQLGGTISGLAGTGLTLATAGEPDLVVASGATSFEFANTLTSGTGYAVTVATQPSNPSQICTVASGSGTVTSAPVSSVWITCTTNTYQVGGTVSGLTGTGLTLATAGEPSLTVPAGATTFDFANVLASGTTYGVTVATQPSSPSQTCTIANANGTVQSGAVSNIAVTCTTNTYEVGGTVSGLTGSGLTLATAGEPSLSVLSGATTFDFSNQIASGTAYTVTVATQPSSPSQTCTVASGSGTVTNGAISNIAVTCTTNTYVVGGTVSGLTGTGLTLGTAGESNLTVPAGATNFDFATSLASGTAYAVSVVTQPSSPSQTCTVASGSGTVTNGAISNIAVTCTTNTYVVGGTVSGLTGTGLTLATAGEPSLTVPAGATSFDFASDLASGTAYTVTVATQPSSPSQTCTVASGSGTVTNGAISNIAVTCTTNTYVVGGTVSGLTGTGLTLGTAGESNLTVPAGATNFDFATSLASGTAYAVSVVTQPSSPSQTCTVASGSGTVTNGAISNIAVTCTTNTYVVGGTVSGLTGTGLTLATAGEPSLTVPAGETSFDFANDLASGSVYAVTVATQPTNPSQSCTVTSGGSGTVTNGAVTSIAVTCTTNTYQVGGEVSGLTGTGLTLATAGESNLTVPAGATNFDFATSLASGTAYAVSVVTQPSSPSQTCAVTSGSGTVTNGAISNIAVTCTTNTYVVGGTVSGLTGTGLTLATVGEPSLTVPAGANSFEFANDLASGSVYAVTVATQPIDPSQTCTVASGGSGTVTNETISNIVVTCATNTYQVGGAISGLAGTGLTLVTAGEPTLTVPEGASTFDFADELESGAAYAVTVGTQPTDPSQTCIVTSGGSGTVTNGAISNIAVTCTTNTYQVGGTVSGLSGSGLTLATAGEANLAVPAGSTSFDFATPLGSGTAYAVTVATQPTNPSQACTVGNGSGSVTSGPVSSISVSCTTSSFEAGGTISGLTGAGLTLATLGEPNLLVPAGATSFSFANSLLSGASYSVSIVAQPASVICEVENGSGVVASSNVSNIAIVCTEGVFSVTGSMATARVGQTATLLPNGLVLIAGGLSSNGSGSCVASAELYNPTTGIFAATGAMTAARCNQTATLLPDGLVLVAGGSNDGSSLSSAELYSPAAGTFTATGSMATDRFGQTATLLPSGLVLIAGGQSTSEGGTDVGTAELYNPSAGTFAATGEMTTPRGGQTATLLPNGLVLIAGGDNGETSLQSAELYNSSTGSFASTGAMTMARSGQTATLLPDGLVLLAGGATLAGAELYDPSSGMFTATGDMTTARIGQTATLLPNGLVLLGGGYNPSGGEYLATAEVYDPSTAMFVSTGEMTAARSNQTATLLPDGIVLMTGGYDATSAWLASAELYTPAGDGPQAGTFVATGNLTTARDGQTATPLPNGLVLLAGGSPGAGTLASAELYNPATSTFIATGNMTAARDCHTSTLLPNGLVLIAGGCSASSNPLPSSAMKRVTIPLSMVYGSDGAVGAIQDDAYRFDYSPGNWTPAGGETFWAALDIGDSGYSPSTLLFYWVDEDTGDGDMISSTGGNIYNGTTFSAFTIQTCTTSPDNGVSCSDIGGWTTVFTSTANNYYGGQYLIPFSGKRWLKWTNTGGTGTFAEFELWDASTTSGNSFLLDGDSITAECSKRGDSNNYPIVPNWTMQDATAQLASGYPAWQPSTAYSVGNTVANTGRVYQCTGAGISAGGGVYTGGDGPHGTGASFTDNTVTWSYVSDAPLWPNIINGGNMGHSSYDALNEIPGYLSSFSATQYFVNLMGANDFCYTSVPNFQSNIQTWINLVQEAGKTPILVHPTWGNDPDYCPQNIPEFNQAIDQLVAANGLMPAIDLYDATYGNSSYMLGGVSVHLSQAGCEVWQQTIAQWVNNNLNVAPGGPALATAELYDPATGVFTATGSMTTGRANPTATLLPNGLVLVAGGQTSSGYPMSSAELYDPATGMFTATGSMTTPRVFQTATLLPNGQVLMAGGFGNGAFGNYESLSSAELYDPATGLFTATSSMTTARQWETATLLPNGQVLVAGGDGGSGTGLASAELYDPSTGTFTAIANMTTLRFDQTATLLPDGSVLIGGGVNGGGYLSSAELYDPTAGLFTATGDMTTPRFTQTATLLSDGLVLITGGGNSSGSLSSAELYYQ